MHAHMHLHMCVHPQTQQKMMYRQIGSARVCLCFIATHRDDVASRDSQILGTLHEAFALLAIVCLCMMMRHAVTICSSGIAAYLRSHLC